MRISLLLLVATAPLLLPTVAPRRKGPPHAPANAEIDFASFKRTVAVTGPLREQRRIPIDTFLSMAQDKHTLILDTRSRAAYDDIHLLGAVHLNFSDFTAEKLAQIIPSKQTRILLYCNNNFLARGVPTLQRKSRPLALNIPTFINLHGYGYTNVYELANLLPLDDTRLRWEGQRAEKTSGAMRRRQVAP